ncbi:MAG: HAMP domain-containing protein, partial [Anaerolinea sp.]|nr:HAMP domain-containing protein [Anaerolinea sp.]
MTPSSPRFVSLRWRLIVPVFMVILIITMISVYVLAQGLASGAEMSRVNVLLTARQRINDNGDDLAALLEAGAYDQAGTLIRGTSIVDVALYQGDRLLTTTLTDSAPPTAPLITENETVYQTILDGVPYLTTGVRLSSEDGISAALLLPENAPFAAEAARQLITLTLVTVAAGVVIAMFLISSLVLERLNNIRHVAESLAAGDMDARTGMKTTDEIGAVGRALDAYADRVRERHDGLRDSLRRQRREIAHLSAVLEALPDGVVVQDMSGSVTFMNDRAKSLLKTEQMLTQAATASVTDALGTPIAPGLRTLGDARRIETEEGRTLSAQSVAVLSLAEQRVGTVTIVRDVTEEAKRERAREAILNQITSEISAPLSEASADEQRFGREIGRHATSLQKLIVEMREINAEIDAEAIKAAQRPIPLDRLMYAIANEWRPAAGAANIDLRVTVERPGLYVLGDERRLRWAIGNMVDNAIKYTPPGGAIGLEIKSEDDRMARLRIRDNGAGIAADELPHIFTRFYRGNPVAKNGRPLRVPGTGQGLTISKTIIEAHGGAITVRSQPGVGTAVYFTLPLTEPEPSASETVLLDDDN